MAVQLLIKSIAQLAVFCGGVWNLDAIFTARNLAGAIIQHYWLAGERYGPRRKRYSFPTNISFAWW
jgi:hypothetical protein